jgi:iron complex transport system substrate-binding protein
MKHQKLLALLLVFLLAFGALSGCAANTEPAVTDGDAPATAGDAAEETAAPLEEEAGEAPAAEPVGFTDMAGREISLEAPATRVVALAAADCEILYAIGAGDTLVGRGEYCDYPAEVADVPSVQSGAETNLEQIIALEPEVLIMSTMAQTEEQVASLEAAGVKVVVSDAQDIEGVYTAIEMIGALTGKNEDAAEVVDSMKQTFAELSARASELDGRTVYFEVSPLAYGLWTAGCDTFMDEIAEMLGLVNVFSTACGWCEVSEEQVIKLNPDVIVTISMYYGEGPTPEEEILSRAGWQDVAAVRENAILNLPNNELSRPGPRLADGAQALFDFVLSVVETENAA